MFKTALDVVNSCLASMGETPLNTLEDDHPYKAAALAALTESNQIEQKYGYWFNSEYTRLDPDAVSHFIYVPQDALSVKAIHGYTPAFGQRGKRLFNIHTSNYLWDKGVTVDLVRLIPFEDLPFHASDCISYSSVVRFQRSFDGDSMRYQQLGQDYMRARNELHAEDARNIRPNLLQGASFQRKIQQIGPITRTEPFIPIR